MLAACTEGVEHSDNRGRDQVDSIREEASAKSEDRLQSELNLPGRGR